MTHKSDFTAEEWALLREVPPLVGLRVAVADCGGSFREVASIAEAYGDAHASWWAPYGRRTSLLDAILDENPLLDRDRFGGDPDHLQVGAIHQAALQCLREAVALLERRGTAGEVEEYAQFVLALARRVAESHTEGAFLGIGGERVSEKEQEILDEIARVVPPTPVP